MKTKLFLLAVLFGAGSVICAAPPRKDDKRPAPGKSVPAKPAPAKPAPARPAPARPAPVPPPAVRPVPPPAKPVVVYQPRRNTYTIQLNLHNGILFEQRIIGMEELRGKIRMVSNDRPRPFIVIRVAYGVPESRLQHALKLLRQAGFHDVKVERLPMVRKAPVVPRKPAPRMKRPAR
ncbi:MAG: hypothetical protein IKC89_06270 [Lentisphaeria bacterium]|nr:hypothetical protein [Lentisphaeria bacterium]